jgi:hypothetical protein
MTSGPAVSSLTTSSRRRSFSAARLAVKNPKRKNQAKQPLQLDSPSSWAMRDPVNGDFWTEDKDNAIARSSRLRKRRAAMASRCRTATCAPRSTSSAARTASIPFANICRPEWDGTPRIERLFIDYVGAPDDAYHRSVSRLMLIAGVTRVFEPGHKFDFAVILEGLQGKRKSTFIETLAKNWFSELDGDFEDSKQMVEMMQGAWILEIPELSGFARADVRHIKAFISRTTDKVRLAYERRAKQYDRQCIFIGSTNDDRYLKDDTGGRRYWPVLQRRRDRHRPPEARNRPDLGRSCRRVPRDARISAVRHASAVSRRRGSQNYCRTAAGVGSSGVC